MEDDLITVRQAAQLKSVSRTAVYDAIQDGRLPHVRVLGRLAVRRDDAILWEPVAYGGRSGSPGRGGKRPGKPTSDEVKAKIAAAQRERWAIKRSNSVSGTAMPNTVDAK